MSEKKRLTVPKIRHDLGAVDIGHLRIGQREEDNVSRRTAVAVVVRRSPSRRAVKRDRLFGSRPTTTGMPLSRKLSA